MAVATLPGHAAPDMNTRFTTIADRHLAHLLRLPPTRYLQALVLDGPIPSPDPTPKAWM